MKKIYKPLYAVIAFFIAFLLLFSAFAPSSINFFMDKAFADMPVFNGVYIIKSNATGRNIAIDIPYSSTESGKYAQSWGVNYTTAQQFRITTDEEGYSTIKNVNSNLYLTAEASNKKDIVQKPQSNNDDQKFKITSDGFIRIKSNENYVFDIKSKKDNDGQHIETYKETGDWNQKWTFLVLENSAAPTTTSTDSASKITYNNYKNRSNVNFNDINYGRTEPVNTKLADSLYKGAVEKDIDKWTALAYSVFGNCPTKDERDYQITIFDDFGGNGWDQDFGNRFMLNSRLNGSFTSNADYSEASGLKFGSSLSNAGSNLYSLIENVIGKHRVKADGYKNAVKLTGLDDDSSRDIIYTNAVCAWRDGATFKYHYNGFGLAFYDFKINLLTAETDENTSGAVYPYTTFVDDGQSGFVSTNSEGGYHSLNITNEETENSGASILNGTSYSTSTSTTSSYEETVEYGQDIGIQLNFGDAIGSKNKVGENGNTGTGSCDSAVNLSFDFSFNEAYAKGFSESEDKGMDENYETYTDISVPPHTAIKAYQSSTSNILEETCNTPVAITYKVMMYSCNGEVYDDGAATGYTGTEGYDADSMSITFGDAQGSAGYGDANYDLYTRACIMNDVSYDGKQGNIKTYSRYHQDRCIEGIDWNKVLKTSIVPGSTYSAKTACDYLCYNYPMSYDGATIACTNVTTDTRLPVAVPLYTIGTIQVDKDSINEGETEIEVADEINLSSWDLVASDSKTPSTPYYGFDKYNGYWKIVDNSGKEIDASSIAEIVQDPVTLDQKLVAKDAGEIYVKYFINEESNDETGAYPYVTIGGDVSKNENITSKGVKIKITKEDPTKDVACVKVSGSGKVNLNEPSNLNTLSGIEASVYNSYGKELDILPNWTAQELESKGIKVEEDGTITCSKTGTFHVAAYINDLYSDWVEIKCVEPNSRPSKTKWRAEIAAQNFAQVEAQSQVQSSSMQETTQNTDSSDSQSSDVVVPQAATSDIASTSSTEQTNSSSSDLLDMAFNVFEKAQQDQATSGSVNSTGTAPTVSNVSDNGNASYNATVNGQQITVTQDSAKLKMAQAGISIEEVYCVMMIYDIGKANGKIPQDKVNQIEFVLNVLFTPAQRAQNIANAYEYGRAAGLI